MSKPDLPAAAASPQPCEDTKRLDWITPQFPVCEAHWSFKPGHHRYYHRTDGMVIGDGKTVRDAIDSAMAAEAETK